MKEQGSALRIVAFAVALAVVLGLASVMFSFTASAEDVTSSRVTLEDGTQVPTINGFSIIGSKSVTNIMINYVKKTYGDGCIFLVAQDITTKDIYYTRYPQFYIHDKAYLYCYCPSGYDTSIPSITSDTSVFDYIYIDDSFKAHHLNYSCSFSFYDNSLTAVSPNLSNLNFYWCYSNKLKWTGRDSRPLSDIVGYSDNSGFVAGVSSGQSAKAKFITCASFTNPDGSFPLWVKDFIAEGHQYPMFTFAISDNGNNHKYSMVLSYNDNDLIAPFIVGMYDELSDSDKRTGFKLTTAISKKFHVPGFVGITNMSDVLKKGCINIFEKNWVNLTYNRAFNLNSSDMDFTDNTGNKVYTITLSDYSAIKANTFYKAELIDLTTSEVLDVTYFTSAQSFNKSDSGNGTKIYDYGDKSDQMWDDLKNNTPSVDPSKGDNFNVGGDVDTNFDNLSNLNINDIISGLRTSISSVSVFFQACWSLFPAAFWSIILLGVSLIIILRILGR